MTPETRKAMEADGYKIYEHAGDAVGLTEEEKQLMDVRIAQAISMRKRHENDRIIIDPNICQGKPVIRGTRTPVKTILNALAGGDDFETLQREYAISADDIRDCIEFGKAQE